jgi:Holliday junction resolvase
MTMQPDWSENRETIERIAQELRSSGYEVMIQPGSSEVPEFLADLQPDIIAKSGRDNVVVEVKHVSREHDRERLRAIARRVESHQGWRFMLVAPETRSVMFVEESRPLETAKVRDWLNEADVLLKSGHSKSALIAAWAGLEGAMRLAVNAHSLDIRKNDSWNLMRELVSNGIVSQDSYHHLIDLYRLRSTFAHGMQPATTPQELELNQAVTSMESLAEQLLTEAEAQHGADTSDPNSHPITA